MPKETMTPRERWLAVLNREEPDRVPMDIWATDEAWDRLCAHVGCDREDVCRTLHIDLPVTLQPRYVGPPLRADEDMWGVRYRDVAYGSGVYRECATHPLAAFNSIEEIDAGYMWPSADWFDFSELPAVVEANRDRPIRGGGSEPFLDYKNLRGEAQAFMDLLLHPEIVHHCLNKMFGFAYEVTRRIFETVPGAVMITYVAEDLGGQDNLMYSPEQIREFFLPGMKRMMDLTKQHGSYVFHHTDGAVREILPDLIDAGIEVLNPIQWRCRGMDREDLKRDFGDRLIFHGGVDNQQTLPFGTPDDVRQEVRDNFRILGDRGGYILAPCHNLQAVTPPENVVALYETGYAEGWH
ncbi:MAG: uroporphyrinogen-III decarboxylase-like protein [Candidatus Hydrogenedentes bacterium]|nr:uroporphyrinogen-III decarboxylase-like protein [Candidatus Hydrogenedentota bacterium]